MATRRKLTDTEIQAIIRALSLEAAQSRRAASDTVLGERVCASLAANAKILAELSGAFDQADNVLLVIADWLAERR